MATRSSDLAFIQDFQKKASEYIQTFFEAEQIADEDERQFKRKERTEAEIRALAAKWRDQRQDLYRGYDRARAIAKRYQIHERFYDLLKIKPAEHNEWGDRMTLTDDLLFSLADTFTRIISAIENAPRGFSRLKNAGADAWAWLDKRNIAKWIVVTAIVLVAFAILNALGYDLNGLVRLIKAIRGEK